MYFAFKRSGELIFIVRDFENTSAIKLNNLYMKMAQLDFLELGDSASSMAHVLILLFLDLKKIIFKKM